MDLPASTDRRSCDDVLVNGAPELVSPLPGRMVGSEGAAAAAAGEGQGVFLPGSGVRWPDSIQMPPWKRCLDLVCIILSLPVWLPVMVLVAIWIKVVSPGPLFFRQERVGFLGRRFMILKFRTMHVNVETQTHELYLRQLVACDRPMTKLDAAGDPRIIRGGRFLRALGLDELPQILNVFIGDMSLVGPRPCTSREFGLYKSWQQERVNAPPGLTGYWQVNGKNRTTFTEMVKLDIQYVRNLSLGLDVWILLRTVPTVFGQLVETWKPVTEAVETEPVTVRSDK